MTRPLEGDYFMTDRLKSAHRTVPYVQPCLVIYFPIVSKNLGYSLKIIIYFLMMSRYIAQRDLLNRKNVIYCINLSSKINYE